MTPRSSAGHAFAGRRTLQVALCLSLLGGAWPAGALFQSALAQSTVAQPTVPQPTVPQPTVAQSMMAQFQQPSPAVPSAPTAQPMTAQRSAALTRGRRLLDDFYAVRLDTLWQSFTPEVRAQWGSLAAFRAFRQGGVAQYGAQRDLVRERTLTDGGVTYYVRSATFQKSPQQVWALIIGFDRQGRVSMFGIVLEEDRSGNPQA